MLTVRMHHTWIPLLAPCSLVCMHGPRSALMHASMRPCFAVMPTDPIACQPPVSQLFLILVDVYAKLLALHVLGTLH